MSEESDYDEMDLDDYYGTGEDVFGSAGFSTQSSQEDGDPEYFDFQQLSVQDVEGLLNGSIEALSTALKISPGLAKQLLHMHGWGVKDIELQYWRNREKLMQSSHIKPVNPPQTAGAATPQECPVCLQRMPRPLSLSCSHAFCENCWQSHFAVQISNGITMRLECMEHGCDIFAPEDFVHKALKDPAHRERYQKFMFRDLVDGHPQLRHCPGQNCSQLFYAPHPHPKKVTCSTCSNMFCFSCGKAYHAPASCTIIKQWIAKCADDSETANYITANTKDCPKCGICIEKNGGCNHMSCYKCKHDFCWMCFMDWKQHGSEYYECSRYKENPNCAKDSGHLAREALKKYLHYYERWSNHERSLRLEEVTLQKIRSHIEDKVRKAQGTWIDWQYLLDAAALLKKCRYTLQYTYPYAYFMDSVTLGLDQKELFELRQGQLEVEVENLSWKVERADLHDRADVEKQVATVEKRRIILLKDFLPSS